MVAIGTIELIGTNKYNDGNNADGDRRAIENIYKLLDNAGYFILILPIENFRYINGRGYSWGDIYNLMLGLFYPIEVTQTHGNWCLALAKILHKDNNQFGFVMTDKRRYQNA